MGAQELTLGASGNCGMQDFKSQGFFHQNISSFFFCLNDWFFGKVFGADGSKGYNAFCIIH